MRSVRLRRRLMPLTSTYHGATLITRLDGRRTYVSSRSVYAGSASRTEDGR